jgi:hypothetical protein
MGHMQLFSNHFTAYVVETNTGSEVVPADAVTLDYKVGEERFRSDGDPDVLVALALLQPYCEGEPQSFEVVEGWWARFSAPGFSDATEWCGPFPTEAEAIQACKDLYGDETDE